MAVSLILAAFIIIVCVLLNNASNKIGVPVLLAFILFGIAFGNNGIAPIDFEDYAFAENISTVALIFIMFYGGFGTRWQSARSIALPAGLLASIGDAVTAGLTGLFCHFVLGWGWLESLLMGSVISSTDAASVFSILRSRKLGLKNNTSPLIEVESGSNDPVSYMLTIIMMTLMDGGLGPGKVLWMLFAQLVFGAASGVLIARICTIALRRIRFSTSGFDSLFLLAVAIASYAVPSAVGGNGYLGAYIAGIIIGNSDIPGKKNLVGFFDGLTGLMQVAVFFLLGLLAKPAMMHKVMLPAAGIFLFLLLVARPAAVAMILTPFRKYSLRQQLCISFAGLRGAASIVFAISATMDNNSLSNDILNIVFCIVLLSIGLQGTLLPLVSRKLGMIDSSSDVMKTFNDFSDETDLSFSEISITADNPWKDMRIKDIVKPQNILFCLVIHSDGTSSVPKGDTRLKEGDSVIMCTKAFHSEKTLKLVEHTVQAKERMAGRRLRDCDTGRDQIVLIRRKGNSIIPNGDTVMKPGDTLYINIGR